MIDREMVNAIPAWKDGVRDRGEGREATVFHLPPAMPSIVEPPVVMMRDKRKAALAANADEFACQDQVAADAQVVRPDQRV